MKNIKFALFVIISLFLISLVNANGLTVIDDSMDVNKTYEIDKDISFQLRNDESFTFYNITFETNDIIQMDMISEITSGQTKNITATIISNSDYNDYIKIKGFYQSTLGASQENYDITIDFIDGLSECDKTLIKGDTITWYNSVNDEVAIKNMVTGNTATTIPLNGSIVYNFDVPEVFTYAVLRRGYQFTDVCTISVLDDSGLINNPEYDTNLFLNIDILYDDTSIETNVFNNNYTMNFYNSKEVIMSIENTGNKTAKNIHFSGEWFTDFNHNDFDLAVGESKNILFNIKPIIFETNQTAKLYNKNLTISGNFDTVYEDFHIYINYAEVTGNYTDGNITSFIEQLCNAYPELCEVQERVIYRDGSNGTDEFNFTTSREQVNGLFAYMFEFGDRIGLDINFLKEQSDTDNQRILTMEQLLSNLTSTIAEERDLREEQSTSGYKIWIFILMCFIIGMMGFIAWKLKDWRKERDLERG